MKTSASNVKIRELVTGIQNEAIVPRPEFQRRLVWSTKDKNSFIETILKGYPFPEIYLADGEVDLETGSGARLLVDGQQRVNTMYEYFTADSSFKLNPSIIPYANLEETQKREFLNYDVAVRDLGSVTREQIIEVFKRINATSYSLNDMEINNAIYIGALKQFAEEMASYEFFESKRFFRPLQLKRMGDVKYVLSLIVSILHGYFNRDDLIEEYLIRYNDEFPQHNELRIDIEAVLAIIDGFHFGDDSRAWKQGDFFTLFVEVFVALKNNDNSVKNETLPQVLQGFYNRVDKEGADSKEGNVRAYHAAVLAAANDRKNRRIRGEIIANLILKSVTLDSSKLFR